jgi:hypothetical protein
MKTFFAILAAFGLAVSAHAQFGQGPIIANAVTNNPLNSVTAPSNPFISLGVSNNAAVYNSNIVAGARRAIQIGPNGFGVIINAAGPLATAITNMSVIFELSANGTIWHTNTIAISYSPMGVNYAPFFTNITPAVFPNVGNVSSVRLLRINNTNSEAVIFTNILVTTRL